MNYVKVLKTKELTGCIAVPWPTSRRWGMRRTGGRLTLTLPARFIHRSIALISTSATPRLD
jgi:hypothetical protein